MRHRATPKFWQFYAALPENIQRLADENYQLLKRDPRHPSLYFRKVGRYWSARVGIHYRAVAVEDGADIVWFWIGHHSEYDHLLHDPLGASVHLTRVEPGWVDPGRNAHGLYFYSENVEVLAAGLGCRAQAKPWGLREFAVSDPDGTLVRVGWPG